MRVPGRLRILVVFLVVCVVALLLTMSLPAGAAPVGQRTVVPAVIFSGHVYIDGTTSPLVGVTIQLYKRSGEFFLYDGETTTASDGSFSFTRGATAATYQIREVNPLLYLSTGAVAPGGAVISNDVVQYVVTGAGSHSGIIFYDRRLVIVTTTPTATPTSTYVTRPTQTPTITPTPITVDLWPEALEVTQAIQDLDNSVTLIAGKRTYVRAHVRANDDNHPGVLGEFKFSTNVGATDWLPAENPGGRIKVREWPGRGFRDHSYYIEVPPSMVASEGTLVVWFRLNNDHAVPEYNYGNNLLLESVPLVESPPMKIKIYNVKYQANSSWHAASFDDIIALVSWLRRAYPVPSVNWQISTLYWPYSNPPGAGENDCLKVDTLLYFHWYNDGSPAGRHYYGMVTDTGSWMRGCAPSIPSITASGPTGSGTWGWDSDGTYGDWYGAHELGHSYGRAHTACSGTEGGPDPNYPYAGGLIGVPGDGSTFYGWDIEKKVVYPPYWTDIMTYCSWLWMSDHTYHGIRGRLLAETAMTSAAMVVDDALLVTGMANGTAGTADLNTLYRLSDIAAAETPTPSDDWALALYGAGDALLARYPFTPKFDSELEAGEDAVGSIFETLAWPDGLARVVVEYQGGEVASRAVSAHAPTVTLVAPNGGETLAGDEATVRWSGSDADDDTLVYALLYSPDAGGTWQTLVSELSASEYDVPLDELPGSHMGLFRVLASDGVNTASDDSDAVFSVESKPPQAIIISPDDMASYVSGQQVVLAGEGYDVEDGLLEDSALSWSSDVQGYLGVGTHLAAAGLQSGRHVITLTAVDSDQMEGSATVTVLVDMSLVRLPLLPK